MVDVLIVDDSLTVVNDVKRFLESQEISVDHAANGRLGVEKFKQNPAYRLAIVDVNMPELDGLGMIAQIREELPNVAANFIMLTTEYDRALKDRGKALGVKGWIVKPFNGNKVINVIQKLLNDA